MVDGGHAGECGLTGTDVRVALHDGQISRSVDGSTCRAPRAVEGSRGCSGRQVVGHGGMLTRDWPLGIPHPGPYSHSIVAGGLLLMS